MTGLTVGQRYTFTVTAPTRSAARPPRRPAPRSSRPAPRAPSSPRLSRSTLRAVPRLRRDDGHGVRLHRRPLRRLQLGLRPGRWRTPTAPGHLPARPHLRHHDADLRSTPPNTDTAGAFSIDPASRRRHGHRLRLHRTNLVTGDTNARDDVFLRTPAPAHGAGLGDRRRHRAEQGELRPRHLGRRLDGRLRLQLHRPGHGETNDGYNIYLVPYLADRRRRSAGLAGAGRRPAGTGRRDPQHSPRRRSPRTATTSATARPRPTSWPVTRPASPRPTRTTPRPARGTGVARRQRGRQRHEHAAGLLRRPPLRGLPVRREQPGRGRHQRQE